jgi:hypothetical protein
MYKLTSILVLLAALSLAGCVGMNSYDAAFESVDVSGVHSLDSTVVPSLAPNRKVSEQDCTKPIDDDGGSLSCK